MSSSLHPLVAQVADRQISTLKIMYAVMNGLVLAMLVVTLILDEPITISEGAGFFWLILALVGMSTIFIGVIMPLARWRLMSPRRLLRASREELTRSGLPENVDLAIGRQAVFLTRYTAGCVVTWGLSAAVSLYGLVARMMGADPWLTGMFFAGAVFVMLIFPPSRGRILDVLRGFNPTRSG